MTLSDKVGCLVLPVTYKFGAGIDGLPPALPNGLREYAGRKGEQCDCHAEDVVSHTQVPSLCGRAF